MFNKISFQHFFRIVWLNLIHYNPAMRIKRNSHKKDFKGSLYFHIKYLAYFLLHMANCFLLVGQHKFFFSKMTLSGDQKQKQKKNKKKKWTSQVATEVQCWK